MRAAEWAEKALDCARALTEQSPEAARDAAIAMAEALNTKGVALARLGRGLEAVREVERSIEVAEAAGLPGAACRGYTNLERPLHDNQPGAGNGGLPAWSGGVAAYRGSWGSRHAC